MTRTGKPKMWERMVATIAIWLLTIFIVGCGGSGGNDDGNDGLPVQSANYSGEIAIALSSDIDKNGTASSSAFTITGSIINLSGQITPHEISWVLYTPDATNVFSFANSGVFVIDAASNWSGTVDLQPGDNKIILSIQDTEASVDLYVTYNPDYVFGGTLNLIPDVAYVNEDRVITATIYLNNLDTDSSDVKLVRVNTNETEVVTMLDDGACSEEACASDASGDKIAGDNVFTGRFTISETSTTTALYRVAVGLASSDNYSRSEIFKLMVTQHLTDTRLAEIIEKQSELQNQLEIAAAQPGDSDIIEDIIIELENDPEVAQVGRSNGGRGIWIIYNDGVGGVLYMPLPDSKGAKHWILEELSRSDFDLSSFGYLSYDNPAKITNSLSQIDVRSPSDVVNRIGSNRAYAIAAQYFEWGYNDDIPKMKTELTNDGRFNVRYDAYIDVGIGSVADFKNLDDYGIVLISSHGDSYYKGLYSLWSERFGWNLPFGIVILHSNSRVTKANKITYEDDMVKGRMVIWGTNYGITPTFIEKYSGNFPNSFVYMSICRGAWNGSMACAFLSSGAGAFVGYSDYVDVPFTSEHGPPLLRRLLEPGKTLGEAFIPGIVEDDSDPAELRMFGDRSLSLGYEVPTEYETIPLAIYFRSWFRPVNAPNIKELIRGEVKLTIGSGNGGLATVQGTGDVEAFYSNADSSGRGVAHIRISNLETTESCNPCTHECYERKSLDYHYLEVIMRNDIYLSGGQYYNEEYTFNIPLDPENDYWSYCSYGDGRQGTYFSMKLLKQP